ncbi:DUF192 domain-containing protein [Brackiella oedipodis]|uniref:DUF192 domain-containing protein n=1 Tax=Brackiella oedipodis TaxID=124225 RepID=UPI000A048895|nr:DUF192 domain-containing protein [Brackiella oedipodis]
MRRFPACPRLASWSLARFYKFWLSVHFTCLFAGTAHALAASPTPTTPTAPPATTSTTDLPYYTLWVADQALSVQLARTAKQRSDGLMFRKQLDPAQGMLFVYVRPQALCFWMKNTTVPLSIAYIDANLRIQAIFDLQPLNEETVCSPAPSQYALEVPQGWFTSRAIEAGATIVLPQFLTGSL